MPPSDDGGRTPLDPKVRKQATFSGVYLLVAIGLVLALVWLFTPEGPKTIPYSQLVELAEQGELVRVVVHQGHIEAEAWPETRLPDEAGETDGEGEDAEPPPPVEERGDPPAPGEGRRLSAERPPEVQDDHLLQTLREHDVEIVGSAPSSGWWVSILFWLVLLLILFGPWLFGMRMMRNAGPMSFARGRIKLHDENAGNQTTFQDVAGVDEAKQELQEVISFLREPERFDKLGARIPKGVLLVGPPGTGKTLLARAVAGEAGVPFFSIAGSEFVEMFAGVGAARVRELFENAKQRAPCIIFLDEIDAIGRARVGPATPMTNDEREQTLNQLLTEMDGFDSKAGVVIIAATNRPEILDPALVRAGRFDRKVIVDAPSVAGRLAILRVHTRSVPLADDIDLTVVARRTPGLVGADLARIVNEAALAATRRGAGAVAQRDFEEAVDRIQLGLERKGRTMNEAEKRRVAYHEAGHTLVAMSVEHGDPVHRVTIIPRTIGALGATLQLPTEDRYLMTRPELMDQLAVLMGGRAAELAVFGEVSTGAQNDLERATETARHMVCRYGMSDKLGPQTFGRSLQMRFLDSPFGSGMDRNFSESRAQEIDDEVERIARSAHERACQVLEQRREELERLAQKLLERETLDQEELYALLGQVPPKAPSLEDPPEPPPPSPEGPGSGLGSGPT